MGKFRPLLEPIRLQDLLNSARSRTEKKIKLYFVFVVQFKLCCFEKSAILVVFSLYSTSDLLFYQLNMSSTLCTNIQHSTRCLVTARRKKRFAFLEITANKEIANVCLNIKKSNYVIFRSHQRKVASNFNLKIFDHEHNVFKHLERKNFVKYLRVLTDISMGNQMATSEISK